MLIEKSGVRDSAGEMTSALETDKRYRYWHLLLLYIYVCMYLAYFVYGYGETRRDEIQDPDVLCWTFCSNFALISSYKMTSITGPGLHVN